MQAPGIPDTEQQRLEALRALKLLDTGDDARLDRITRIALRHFGVPIALISLIDANRQWFKSRQGLEASETPRDVSFCGHAILGEDVFVVEDALADQRFADNPLVTGPPHIRFYAGAPLAMPDGHRVGTLCIIDRQARTFPADDRQGLRELADWLQDELRNIHVREAADSFQRQEARLKAILDTVVDAIITIDDRGAIETANPAAERLFGYTLAELAGQNVNCLMPAPYRNEHDGYLRRYLETRVPRVIGIGREVVGRRKDGTVFPMELAVSETLVEGRRSFTGIVRDISERKRLERMKSEFVSTVSHELRTPLTSIHGSLGLLIGGAAGELPEKAKELAQIACNNSDRLVRLISDILDMEKIESGRMIFSLRPVEIGVIARETIAANEGYCRKLGVAIALDDALAETKVLADPDRLNQVITNLISNAAKFSPVGETVHVSLAPIAQGVRLSVADRGPGIPEEFRPHIFERFSQADSSDTRQVGGTGLGLSITMALVARFGGRLSFDTERGAGTTFHVDLPLWSDAPILARSGNTGAAVLVCEDDADTARMLAALLEARGLETDIACSAEEAWQKLAANCYAAMTLDLRLPGQDGLSLLRQLRAETRTAQLPVVIVSGDKPGDPEHDIAGLDVEDWLLKPIDEDRLIRAVRRVAIRKDGGLPRLLHVEDNLDILGLVTGLLEGVADAVPAPTLAAARGQLAGESAFDLILLDIALPDGSGLDLLPAAAERNIPVVIFSAHEPDSDTAGSVAAVLVKSRIDNARLGAIIEKIVKRHIE